MRRNPVAMSLERYSARSRRAKRSIAWISDEFIVISIQIVLRCSKYTYLRLRLKYSQILKHFCYFSNNMAEPMHQMAVFARVVSAGSLSAAARDLASNRRVVCASPAYLAQHGTPRTPEELVRHNCLTAPDLVATWAYKGPDGKPGSVRVTGRYACDNWEVIREWARAGLGVALKSTWDVRRHLEDGTLALVCAGYTFGTDVGIYAVYPHRRHLSAKTRAFIEFLADSFGPEPAWDRPAGRPPKPRIRGRAAVV